MKELEKSLQKLVTYLSYRGRCPDFVVLTDNEDSHILLPAIEYLTDPETGMLYLAYCIDEIEEKLFTSLHQAYRIEKNENALFARQFVVKNPDKLSTVMFTHYACAILNKAAQSTEHIILNHFIPECR